MTQVNIVEPSASQADSAGSIPVIGSTKNTLPQGNSRNPNAATTGTVPNTAPNALPLDSTPNRTNATRPAIAASLPTTEPRLSPASAETIPAWEATARRSGLLPAVGADTAHDPGYIRARLQELITRAARSVADIEVNDRHVVAAAELTVLRGYIEQLSEELRPYSRTGEEMLADLNRAHPGMSWCPVTNGFSGSSNAGDDAAVAAALALRLPEVEPVWGHCAREWRGVIEGWQVSVSIFRPYTQQ